MSKKVPDPKELPLAAVLKKLKDMEAGKETFQLEKPFPEGPAIVMLIIQVNRSRDVDRDEIVIARITSKDRKTLEAECFVPERIS